MWGRIVKEMEKGAYLELKLKKAVWKSLFGFELSKHCCFACDWHLLQEDILSCVDGCLLQINSEENGCLDGLFDIATGLTDQRIEAARKIRDLPMKDKWK